MNIAQTLASLDALSNTDVTITASVKSYGMSLYACGWMDVIDREFVL